MKQVENHIISLLDEKGVAVLPGFGGFVKYQKPSIFDKSSGKFYPPTYGIRFNEFLKEDDATLATTMAQEDQIPLEEARESLRAYIEVLKDTIYNGEVIWLNGIGNVFLKNDLIQFQPALSNNIKGDEFFGLKKLTVKPLKSIEKVQKKSSAQNGQLFKVATICLLVVNLLLITAITNQKLNAPNFASWFSFSKTSTPIEFYTSRNDRETLGFSENKVVFKSLEKSFMFLKKRSRTRVDVEEKTAEGKSTKSKVMVEGHFIISGCFKVEENAMSHLHQVKKNGFVNAGIIDYNGMKAVYLSHSQTKSEAVQELLHAKQKTGARNWILSL